MSYYAEAPRLQGTKAHLAPLASSRRAHCGIPVLVTPEPYTDDPATESGICVRCLASERMWQGARGHTATPDDGRWLP